MRTIILVFIIFIMNTNVISQNKKTLYLFAGQGSDERLFKNFEISNTYEVKYLKYIVPEKNDDMFSYSKKIAEQIDTTERFSIIGVSLGGMLAIEMNKYINPEEIILIASAKNNTELPQLYKFFNFLPIHKLVGGNFIKFWTYCLQPFYEPLSKKDQALWRSMLKQKDKHFMKRMVKCIIEWNHEHSETKAKLYHLHGKKDKTLPSKFIKNAHFIEDGTHIMTLTKGKELSSLIENLIEQ